jgi:hypothetical protein
MIIQLPFFSVHIIHSISTHYTVSLTQCIKSHFQKYVDWK